MRTSLVRSPRAGTPSADVSSAPATAALFGDTPAVADAEFGTGLPPNADRYEIVPVGR